MICWHKSSDRGIEVMMKKLPKWSVGVILGVIFLVLGAFGNQFTEIYRKAVMICLECIGIG